MPSSIVIVLLSIAVFFLFMLQARGSGSLSERMRRGKEILRRYDSERNKRPLGL